MGEIAFRQQSESTLSPIIFGPLIKNYICDTCEHCINVSYHARFLSSISNMLATDHGNTFAQKETKKSPKTKQRKNTHIKKNK